MSIEKLVAMSQKYGSNVKYVLAGGGNTSYKDDEFLYVKGSGTSLATITKSGFVKMRRALLDEMMTKRYSVDDDQREAEALVDMMNARADTVNGGRPSVEALLHNLFPQKYVLHLHPAAVNGLTCGKEGEEECRRLFSGEAVWIPITKPGYILAKTCFDAMNEYKKAAGRQADLVILQNHGVFAAADTVEQIDALMAKVMDKIEGAIKEQPDFTPAEFDGALVQSVAPKLRMLYGKGSVCTFFTDKQLQNPETFSLIEKPFTPDHIVYCKANYLRLKQGDDIKAEFIKFKDENGYAPKIVYLENQGYFALGDSKKEAETSKLLLLDAVKIGVYSKSFGGRLPMRQEFVDFIVGWEVESYRAKAGKTAAAGKRMDGKIIIVTGSAQGFGKGIAENLAEEGANVVIADMNYAGAEALAKELCKKHGAGRAFAVGVNVADEPSVKNLIEQTVFEYGGLDVFINNAGIVRAGSLEEMTKENFELVTSVNYTAYFLCAKYAVAPMKAQHEICPDYMMDIVEVNSKSGLKGSNKNFAYAGSKFGGLGLTESFALELAPYNIKVNAVCPGNFLDGPLWSDPEKGLFVQYFNAGKVPGAKTVDDVRRHYESLVPLGRGCLPSDVSKAIMYIVEQPYETGQALPVTGGQEMLK